jgi:hypothetical protein
MTNAAKTDWLIPTALLALGFVPMLAGTLRLVQLGVGAEITPANARFFAAPLPFVLHMVSATLFSAFGAMQFAPGLRRRNPGWHRMAGRWLIPFGLGAGTQVFTHLPWFLFPGIQGEVARALCMGAGWAINLAVAEWLISRGRK